MLSWEVSRQSEDIRRSRGRKRATPCCSSSSSFFLLLLCTVRTHPNLPPLELLLKETRRWFIGLHTVCVHGANPPGGNGILRSFPVRFCDWAPSLPTGSQFSLPRRILHFNLDFLRSMDWHKNKGEIKYRLIWKVGGGRHKCSWFKFDWRFWRRDPSKFWDRLIAFALNIPILFSKVPWGRNLSCFHFLVVLF